MTRMTYSHCVAFGSEEINDVDGVRDVAVNLSTAAVTTTALERSVVAV
jgi:copper chaperone CopZ